MKILLTNDDGYSAKGITLLFDTLTELGYDTYMVAPETEKSGASHSITLHHDLVAKKVADKIISVSGTPADCVIYATHEVATDFDLVVSGINAGQNMGEDIFYSGTVAAATEACFLGYPALAFSMCAYEDQNYEAGVEVVVKIISLKLHEQLKKNELLNINIPNIPYEKIRGFQVTKIGERRYKNFIRLLERDENKTVYRVGGDIPEYVQDNQSDYYAISNNFVSITHLLRKSDAHFDLNVLQKVNNYEI
ncbi:MAG: 5'/3'-nucleotidase SurE [Candidatus Cloacimonadales bacterium]